MKYFITLLFSFSLTAQSTIEQLNPSCEKLKRLDEKGEVLDGHPIQHQGNLGTCYANTASLMFYSKYKKENPNSNVEQFSWLSLAQKSKEKKLNELVNKSITNKIFKEGGGISQVYESVKGTNICAIPTKKWSTKEFNSSLESNAYLFERIMNKYENLFEDKSTFANKYENEQYISNICFDNLNKNFDNRLKKNLIKARHVEDFSVFWKYLKQPKIENLKKFKDYYMTHIFTSSFKEKESNALRFIFSDSFFSGPSEIFIDSELDSFIEKDQLTKFKENFYPNAVGVAEAQEKALEYMKKELNKQFVSCVETSLQAQPNNSLNSCNSDDQKKVKDLVDFASTASQEGVSPSFIQAVLTMTSPLKTKQEILNNFMKNAYKNCSYKIGDDWQVVNMQRKKLDQIAKNKNLSTTDFSFDVYEALIDLNLVGSISIDNNLLKNEMRENKSTGTHAMAVIGSASGCDMGKLKNQRCILIQNSYGQNTESADLKGTINSSYPPYMQPGFKTKETYKSGKSTLIDENLAYGKFWICDPVVIDRYLTGVGAIK